MRNGSHSPVTSPGIAASPARRTASTCGSSPAGAKPGPCRCSRSAAPTLFSVRRADIETFARELEGRGRARATVTRRLSTIAGFYRYAVEEELRHGAARIVRRVTRRAGISKQVSPHTLRHAFITAALDAGVPLRDVQEAASHADPRTTMRYDRARTSLDRHATYIVATYIAGAATGSTASATATTSVSMRSAGCSQRRAANSAARGQTT
jgi:Phage integrase family/Phage integrase, N-terminal SAM-like domain